LIFIFCTDFIFKLFTFYILFSTHHGQTGATNFMNTNMARAHFFSAKLFCLNIFFAMNNHWLKKCRSCKIIIKPMDGIFVWIFRNMTVPFDERFSTYKAFPILWILILLKNNVLCFTFILDFWYFNLQIYFEIFFFKFQMECGDTRRNSRRLRLRIRRQ
jgi:hypothetical protein